MSPEFSLLVVDECHHTHKDTVYNIILSRYLQHKLQRTWPLPQVLGLTASPGTGRATKLDGAIDHILQVSLAPVTSTYPDPPGTSLACPTRYPPALPRPPPAGSGLLPHLSSSLQRLLIALRINTQLSTLAYKVPCDLVPAYLSSLISSTLPFIPAVLAFSLYLEQFRLVSILGRLYLPFLLHRMPPLPNTHTFYLSGSFLSFREQLTCYPFEVFPDHPHCALLHNPILFSRAC